MSTLSFQSHFKDLTGRQRNLSTRRNIGAVKRLQLSCKNEQVPKCKSSKPKVLGTTLTFLFSKLYLVFPVEMTVVYNRPYAKDGFLSIL